MGGAPVDERKETPVQSAWDWAQDSFARSRHHHHVRRHRQHLARASAGQEQKEAGKAPAPVKPAVSTRTKEQAAPSKVSRGTGAITADGSTEDEPEACKACGCKDVRIACEFDGE
eukprot:768360-Hanusia_phi.AAC.1